MGYIFKKHLQVSRVDSSGNEVTLNLQCMYTVEINSNLYQPEKLNVYILIFQFYLTKTFFRLIRRSTCLNLHAYKEMYTVYT